MMPPKDERWLPAALGGYALAAGLITLTGWTAGVDRLIDWSGSGIAMKANAAIAAACAGTALIVAVLRPSWFWLVRALAAVTLMLGGATLLEHVIGLDLGIDTILFDEAPGALATTAPGRMGPPASTSFLLLGSALIIMTLGSRARSVTPCLGTAALAISMLSLVGYLYGARLMFGVAPLTGIALQTASIIFALGLGVIGGVPEHQPMRTLRESSPAGAIARRALPIIVMIPPALGWIRLRGQEGGLYDTAFGTALLMLVLVALLVSLLGWSLSALSKHETALRESERRLTRTLDSITDGFVIFDREWRYTFVNEEAARLLGRSRSELMGRKAWDVFPETVGSKEYDELHRAAATRVSAEFEAFNPNLGCWFANKAYPTADGGMSVYFADVTARRIAEDALRKAQEAQAIELADFRLLHDASTSLIREGDINALYAKIVDAAVGIMRSDFGSLQVLEKEQGALRLLAFRNLSPAAEAVWNRAQASGASTWGLASRTRERVIVPDVEQADFMAGTDDLTTSLEAGIHAVQSTPLFSRSGNLLGILSTHWRSPHMPSERDLRVLDILARQAADLMERMEAEAALREGDRRKDEFLAMLSHELRNPLNAIVGWAQILRDSPPGAETIKKAVEIIHRNAQVQNQLISDMLDVSSIIAGKMRLRVAAVDLAGVIGSAVDTVRPAADARGVRVEMVLDPKTGPMSGDSERLQQVVWNLLSNAIKFAPEKRGQVQLRVQAIASHVRITVEDNGPGIDPDFLPHVFERFSQADSSTARRHKGLGLGLAIVRHLVELHGGTVQAKNLPRGGALFVIDLPRLGLAALPPPQVGDDRQPSAAEGFVGLDKAPSLLGLRILVVDDELDARELLKTVLARCGAQVIACGSARDGLAALTSERPDVLVADIEMPEQNGYEFIREVRALPAGEGGLTPAAALTAYAGTLDRTQALNAGFQAHLPKPVQPAELATVIASLGNGSAPRA